jgi:hypothetical protein
LSERLSFIEKLLKMVSDLDLAHTAKVVDQLLPLLHGHRLDASPHFFEEFQNVYFLRTRGGIEHVCVK